MGKLRTANGIIHDVPINANVLLDDIDEVIIYIRILPGFGEVYDHVTYDENDKLRVAGIMGSYAGNKLKRRVIDGRKNL